MQRRTGVATPWNAHHRAVVGEGRVQRGEGVPLRVRQCAEAARKRRGVGLAQRAQALDSGAARKICAGGELRCEAAVHEHEDTAGENREGVGLDVRPVHALRGGGRHLEGDFRDGCDVRVAPLLLARARQARVAEGRERVATQGGELRRLGGEGSRKLRVAREVVVARVRQRAHSPAPAVGASSIQP